MTTRFHADYVRRIALRIFDEFGDVDEPAADLDETIILDDGKYVGRTYRAGKLFATWLINVGILQFYDADGDMQKTIDLMGEVRPLRRAA